MVFVLKTIRSVFLWAIGSVFFFLVFILVATALFLFPPKSIYPMVRRLMRLQLALMGIRLKVRGQDTFDPGKAYLILGNHESMFDLFAIPAALPMHSVSIEAAYHFSIPLWGYLVRKWGNIPAHRNNAAKAVGSLKHATRVLKSGTPVVLLPEGGRTHTGEIGAFKKGACHLALTAKTDILPFVIKGLFEYNSIATWQLLPGPACVVFGRPIAYRSFKDSSVEELTRRVRTTMIDLKNS